MKFGIEQFRNNDGETPGNADLVRRVTRSQGLEIAVGRQKVPVNKTPGIPDDQKLALDACQSPGTIMDDISSPAVLRST